MSFMYAGDKKMKVVKMEPQCLITGTRAYGPVSENSDLDIVMRNDHIQILENFLLGDNINIQKVDEHYASFYFTIPGLPKINVIVAENQEVFDEWEYATEKMKKLRRPISDHEKRVETFARLRKQYRSIHGMK